MGGGRRRLSLCRLVAKFHYTGPTGPARTRTGPHGLFRETRAADPGLRQSLRTLSGRVGSGRARVVEFSYKQAPVSAHRCCAASRLDHQAGADGAKFAGGCLCCENPLEKFGYPNGYQPNDLFSHPEILQGYSRD